MKNPNQTERARELKTRYLTLLRQSPNIRARSVAKSLGVSESELLASRVGDGVTRLDDAEAILKSARSLGQALALTRNEFCVHERKGVYENHQFFKHGKTAVGLFVNPDIDLRLSMDCWKYAFAVTEQPQAEQSPTERSQTEHGHRPNSHRLDSHRPAGRGLKRKSIQFFDGEGVAVHKIYLTPDSDENAFDQITQTHRSENQDSFIETRKYPPAPPERPDSEIDWKAFRGAWENLKDTHDFFPMLKNFGVGRLQALRGIGRDFARETDIRSARRTLELARDKKCEIMVFTANRGCIQIHTGAVQNCVEKDGWFNVLDKKFNLHLSEAGIARSYVTKKPIEDGIVTALEIFDASGALIATLFGKRKPGVAELGLWREIIAEISGWNDDA